MLPAHSLVLSLRDSDKILHGFRQNPLGIQLKGTLPLEHLGVDFTEMKPHLHYHYLLVMVCAFPRWVKAFPTWTERTSEIALPA